MGKTFVVLAMHRTASSLVGRGMASQMFFGYHFLPPNEHNPLGYWEDKEFVMLNEAILHAAGGTWDAPPPEDAILACAEQFTPHIKKLVEKRNRIYDIWGWKDPRTVLTIRLYLPYLRSPHFIACVRDPREVGESLHRRDSTPLEKAIALAREYNRRLVTFLAEFGHGNY